MKRFISKKTVAIGLTAGLVLGVGGSALAFWTQSGAGDGTATTGHTTDIVVNETTSAADLYPGGPAQALAGDFTNPNSGVTSIGHVVATLGTLPSGCVAADFTIDNSAETNSATLSNGTGGTWSGITIKMNNTGDDQNGCKDQNIPVHYALSAS